MTEEIKDTEDTIEVPDELVEAMGTDPKTEELNDGLQKEAPKEPKEEDPKPEVKKEENDPEQEKEAWKPKHNPDYYKKKGEKTRKHIRDLTTQRYEAQQTADRLRVDHEVDQKEIADLREKLNRSENPGGNSQQLKKLDESIEFAEEDENDYVAGVLRDHRQRLVDGEKLVDSNQQRETSDTAYSKAPPIDPSAQQWLDDNQWFNKTDDLGRLMYPQLKHDAEQQESRLRQTMPIGKELYAQLSKDMEQTLDAYNINHEPAKSEKTEKPEDPPKPSLQPARGGGAEKQVKKGNGQLTDAEHARMVALFEHTGMDKDNPDHRKIYLANLRN